ncbi:MAG: carbamate kinase [Methanotrichaceae archaeon]|nr:carbamate kinase [Methanotrichaceae archaeon]
MTESATRPAVLAFGGNALLPDPRNPNAQEENARAFADGLKLLLPKDAGMAVVHGNGPQVGMIMLRIEATRDRIPPESLDVLVAETQGSMGYLLTRALRSSFLEREVAAVLTQVTVDPEDPGFKDPSKPIGPFYSEEEAVRLKLDREWKMAKVSGKGWRRTVASPMPKEIVEIHTIADAVSHGHVIIAGGGGGIPVFRRGKLLQGVEAVVDKDFTASLLAIALQADRFVILTDVPHVSLGFGSAVEQPVHSMSADEAERLLDLGEFPPGSMGPKVKASILYARATGKKALITDLDHLADALEGQEGTWVMP